MSFFKNSIISDCLAPSSGADITSYLAPLTHTIQGDIFFVEKKIKIKTIYTRKTEWWRERQIRNARVGCTRNHLLVLLSCAFQTFDYRPLCLSHSVEPVNLHWLGGGHKAISIIARTWTQSKQNNYFTFEFIKKDSLLVIYKHEIFLWIFIKKKFKVTFI